LKLVDRKNRAKMPYDNIESEWRSLIEQWKETQSRLSHQLIVEPLHPPPRFVAGADAAFSADKRTIYAAAVVYDRERRSIVDRAQAMQTAEVPYIPGFLSFREGPAVLDALGKLRHEFGVILFDGHGYAHPRRCGFALHLAVTLDRPGVGVAKSRLVGSYEPPAAESGSSTPLEDQGEEIGLVLRTRANVNPLFISVAHRVDLESARQLVLACCTRYRLPEPTRQADAEVAKLKQIEDKL
jgi:deoxyribonuclease V